MNKNMYNEYINELKKTGKEPTKQELQLLGKMIISEKWYNFKQKLRLWKHEK